jgi:uncharacterized protein (TIGR02246 family)
MTPGSDAKTEIRAMIESWAAAVRRKDMDGILAHHTEDFVMFDVPPPLVVRGLDAYRATWPLFFNASPETPAFDIRALTIEADGNVAFAVALMRCIYVQDGATRDLDFRLTIGLRKIAGRWMFVHEHHSVPATD